MMDKQSFAIGCLSLSAVFLLVGVFVLVAVDTQRAEASDMIDSGGTYTLLTGALGPASDLIYLIDTKTDRLVAYKVDEQRRILVRTFVAPLDEPGTAKQQPRRKLRP